MSHVNANFDFYNNADRLVERIKHLELDIELKDKKISYLQSELENIVEAVLQFGYVEIDIKGTGKITLIQKPVDKEQGE